MRRNSSRRRKSASKGVQRSAAACSYTADIHRPNMLWAAFAGSPLAHARIARSTSTAAKAIPGVSAVLTGRDIGPQRFGPAALRLAGARARHRAFHRRSRRRGRRRDARRRRRSGRALVEVDYEELPAVLDAAAALAAGCAGAAPGVGVVLLSRVSAASRRRDAHPNMHGADVLRERRRATSSRSSRRRTACSNTPSRRRASTAGFIEPHATLVWIDDEAGHWCTCSRRTSRRSRCARQLAHVAGLRRRADRRRAFRDRRRLRRQGPDHRRVPVLLSREGDGPSRPLRAVVHRRAAARPRRATARSRRCGPRSTRTARSSRTRRGALRRRSVRLRASRRRRLLPGNGLGDGPLPYAERASSTSCARLHERAARGHVRAPDRRADLLRLGAARRADREALRPRPARICAMLNVIRRGTRR